MKKLAGKKCAEEIEVLKLHERKTNTFPFIQFFFKTR